MGKRKSLHQEEDDTDQRHVKGQRHSVYQLRNHSRSPADYLQDDHKNSKKETSSRAVGVILKPGSSESAPRNHSPSSDDGRGIDRRGTGKRSKKIAKLLKALDDVLMLACEDGEESTQYLGQEVLLQCERLRITLAKTSRPRSNLADAPAATTHSAEIQSPYLDPLLLQAPSPSFLTPWTISSITSTLPPLPTVKSPTLEKAAFTHRGVTSQAGDVSYERLEWIGDGYIYLIACLLVSSTFTSHSPGRLSQVREICVKNETLASYARAYGFAKRARLPIEYLDSPKKGVRATEGGAVKVLGDIFEAYVAAVVLSDPDHGLERVCTWLKTLWAQTVSEQITEQMRQNKKAKELADTGGGELNLNPKVLLMKKIGAKGIKLQYKDAGPETKDPKTGFPIFTVGVYLDGWGEHEKQLGVGQAMKKTEAGNKAAETVLSNKKLIAKYEAMKKLHDENMKAAKELNGLASSPPLVSQPVRESCPAAVGQPINNR